ncbi:MAG: proline--tRNA ligase [Magnetococcales bacterium]|nr:proline--tRNA ligase [Magnetococcales bacterium]
MRFSQTLIPTLRENPVEAQVVSHRLMLRAGLIRQLNAGIYTWLPLGLRVLRRVETIVRQEMDRAGAQEVLMRAVQPAELWEESGRWAHYGKELLRMKDRHDRDFCFGPTHEEVITDLVRREVRSYKQLPLNFYQIQTKFRDEIRPRFGIMRGREFLMKDAYSFDKDVEALDVSYKAMFAAYQGIFQRCGLEFRAVEADTGSIGGASSHEFHVLAESGEDTIASCTNCGYAANLEKAVSGDTEVASDGTPEPMARIETPNKRTIEEVSSFLKVPVEQTVKSLIVETEEGLIMLVLRGDHVLNEVKAMNALGVTQLTLPEPERVRELTGVPVGSIGPVGTEITIVADPGTQMAGGFVCGANEAGWHLTNVVWERDLPAPRFVDLRNVTAGEPCPRCDSGTLVLHRGIEVGHVFKLGEKYSQAMNAVVLDENGREKTLVMGCYGIGVSRIVAAAIEQNHDDNGIIWPMALAPFQVMLLVINPKDKALMEAASALEKGLSAKGVDVLTDDRDERLGVKFKDADLTGIPLRVVIGGRSLKEGKLEIQSRRGGDPTTLSPDDAVEGLYQMVQQELALNASS